MTVRSLAFETITEADIPELTVIMTRAIDDDAQRSDYRPLGKGGDYVLAGGFWGGVAVEYRIYLPLVLRNNT
jgi:hypothetical protein